MKNWIRVGIGVCVLVAVGATAGFLFPSVDLTILDWWFILRTFWVHSGVGGDVLVIKITEETEKRIGYYFNDPEMKGFHAALVERLNGLHKRPRVIGFDLRFERPSKEDRELAEAFRKAGNVVIASRDVPGSLPAVFQGAAKIGFATSDYDPDRKIRRIEVVRKCIQKTPGSPGAFWYFPSFSLQVLAVAMGKDVNADLVSEEHAVRVAGSRIPLERNVELEDCSVRVRRPRATMMIDFARSEVKAFEYKDVLFGDGRQIGGGHSIDVFSGSIVLVGATHADSSDIHETPLRRLAGVEVLAIALETVLQERWLGQLDPMTLLILQVTFGFLLITLYLVDGTRWVFWACLAWPFVGSMLAFGFGDTWIDVGSLVAAGLLVPAAHAVRLLPRELAELPSPVLYGQAASIGVVLGIYPIWGWAGFLGASVAVRTVIAMLVAVSLRFAVRRRKLGRREGGTKA